MLSITAGIINIAVAQNAGSNPVPDNNTGVAQFPNYHPLVVHFPIVLLLVAAAMQIANLYFKSKAYNYSIVALTIGGFIGALLAAIAFHPEPVHNLNATARNMFETHETFAAITLWVSGAASLFKIWSLFNNKKWIEGMALVLLLGSAVTVSVAGHYGSALVYKQGVGPEGNKLSQEDND